MCDLARSSSGNPPAEHGPVQLHRRFRHFVNPDPAHFRSASVLMASPTTQGGQSSPPVATLPPPAGPQRVEPSARSCRMPRQPLGAPENLAKRRPCQVAFRELQGEIPSVPDGPIDSPPKNENAG